MEFSINELDFIIKEVNERIKHHRMHYYSIYNQEQEDKIAILEKFKSAIRTYGCKLIQDSLPKQFPDEAAELDRLLKALHTRAIADCNEGTDSSFEIHINNEVITLTLGGPQIEGLCKLINHIADENFYLVDYKNNEVKGWYEFPVNGAATTQIS